MTILMMMRSTRTTSPRSSMRRARDRLVPSTLGAKKKASVREWRYHEIISPWHQGNGCQPRSNRATERAIISDRQTDKQTHR